MIPACRHRLTFVITDYLTTLVAWTIFNLVRYFTLGEVNFSATLIDFFCYDPVILGEIFIPLIMIGIYWLSGFYNVILNKSRAEVFLSTLGSVLISVVMIYFVAIIDDPIPDRYDNYVLILILTGLFMAFVLVGRIAMVLFIQRAVVSGRFVDRVVVYGDRQHVEECIGRLLPHIRINAMQVVAVALTDVGKDRSTVYGYEPLDVSDLAAECDRAGIARIILAVGPDDSAAILSMVRSLYFLNRPIMLPAWSSGALMSRIKLSNVAGVPLADLTSVGISESQRNVKRTIDVALSVLSLIILSPLMAVIAVLVKRDSPGPVFYSQRRIGMHCRPFHIYKFRTMCVDAEADGHPRLSSDDDPRVTRLGRFLRKYRLDEIPQFWNVLKGDMSLVGPRPEREYYEELILRRAPYYALVHQVRPGITSWGMVKYGYATSVDQMVERLAFDMVYLENISVSLDMKIMFFTVRTVLTGQGV